MKAVVFYESAPTWRRWPRRTGLPTAPGGRISPAAANCS